MSLSIYNSTIIPLQSGNSFVGSYYDNILDFAEIDISILCDTGYDLTYYFSQDKINISYQTSQTVSPSVDTLFFKQKPLERYFKIGITATGGNMTILNVQTIYKSNITYETGAGVSQNVSIQNPLDGNGNVLVSVANNPVVFIEDSGGNTINSTLGALNANLYTSSGVALTTTYNGSYLNYSLDTNNKVIESCVSSNQLAVNIDNINTNYIDAGIGGLKVAVQNPSLTVSESALDACIASNQVAVNVANSTPINVSNIIPNIQSYQRVVVSSGSTTSGSVSGSHKLVSIIISSNDNGASASYLKLYDLASPTLGTDTPLTVITLGNYNFGGDVGINFTNAIGYGISGGIADNDTSGANSDISLTLIYI